MERHDINLCSRQNLKKLAMLVVREKDRVIPAKAGIQSLKNVGQ